VAVLENNRYNITASAERSIVDGPVHLGGNLGGSGSLLAVVGLSSIILKVKTTHF